MSRIPKVSNALCNATLAIAFLPIAHAQAPHARALREAITTVAPSSSLWRDRGNVGSLDLFYGAGGKEHEPSGTFTFTKEDTGGTQPKFDIVDRQGVHWKAKLGVESKSETAATRLLWAAGYFTDEDYYLPELRVEKMPKKLRRGSKFVLADGTIRGVRLERSVKGQKKIGTWNWSKHPLAGTREMNGLRTMMALLNNWDLKTPNNSIYEVPGEAPYYAVTDLGATFGKTGGIGVGRSKSRLDDYCNSKFIDKTELEEVDLRMKSRPIFLLAIDPYNYFKLSARAKVGKNIPRTHAKWLGGLLGQLSAGQIRDCFRSAGYSPKEVEGFAKAVQARIADLNRL